MNIKQALTNEHSKRVTKQIVNYVGTDKNKLKELMQLFFCDDKDLSQRASWPLRFIGKNHPELVKPYFKKMILQLSKNNIHDAVKRNILGVFECIDIPMNHSSQLFDLCLQFISSELYPVGIRAFAITTATNICQKIPGLKSELKLILNALLEEEQMPAIKVRLRENFKRL